MGVSKDLKKVLLIGLGAMAITGEKAIEIVETLSAKGELAMEQGKVLNEELRCSIKKSVPCHSDRTTDRTDINIKKILDHIDSLTPEEITALEDKLAGRKGAQ